MSTGAGSMRSRSNVPEQHQAQPHGTGQAAPARAANNTSPGSARRASHRSSPVTGWRRAMLGMLSTGIWMLMSTALIVANKRIYQLGFTHPFFVTGMGQVFSALGGWVLVQLGVARLRPCPPWRVWVFKLAPVIASTSATMFYGNASYLTLSVAFIQILKAFTPALTLVLCVGAGLERVSAPLVISILLIAGGTASAVLVETNKAAFHVWGFLNFMASSITEAMRVVGAEVLLGASRYNSTEALVYIGGPTSIVLLLCSGIWESQAILHPSHGTLHLMFQHPATFLVAFLLSFLVNLSCFFAIQYTSSLTFKVAGCMKNAVVVWYGVAAHGENVNSQQILGYVASTAGFVMYSWLKAAPARAKVALSSTSGGARRQAYGSVGTTSVYAHAGGSRQGNLDNDSHGARSTGNGATADEGPTGAGKKHV